MSPMDPFATDESHPTSHTDPVSGCKPGAQPRAPTNNNENTQKGNRKGDSSKQTKGDDREEELAAQVVVIL